MPLIISGAQTSMSLITWGAQTSMPLIISGAQTSMSLITWGAQTSMSLITSGAQTSMSLITFDNRDVFCWKYTYRSVHFKVVCSETGNYDEDPFIFLLYAWQLPRHLVDVGWSFAWWWSCFQYEWMPTVLQLCCVCLFLCKLRVATAGCWFTEFEVLQSHFILCTRSDSAVVILQMGTPWTSNFFMYPAGRPWRWICDIRVIAPPSLSAAESHSSCDFLWCKEVVFKGEWGQCHS